MKIWSEGVEIVRRQRAEKPIRDRKRGRHVLLRKIRARARVSPSRPRPGTACGRFPAYGH